MDPLTYRKPSLVKLTSLLVLQLETASTAVVRLDEQVSRLGRVGDGYRTRSDFQEACALRAWRSALMAAAMMRAGGMTLHHQFALAIGARKSRYRYDGRTLLEQRVAAFLDWVKYGAIAGQNELKRLSLAHQVLGQVARSKHVDSRLPALSIW